MQRIEAVEWRRSVCDSVYRSSGVDSVYRSSGVEAILCIEAVDSVYRSSGVETFCDGHSGDVLCVIGGLQCVRYVGECCHSLFFILICIIIQSLVNEGYFNYDNILHRYSMCMHFSFGLVFF